MLVRRLMTGLVAGLLTGGVVAADYPTFLRDYPDLLPEKTLVLISGDGERHELTVRELSLQDHLFDDRPHKPDQIAAGDWP